MWKFMNKWHRRLGIVAALFVIMLVVTGLLLNHTGALTLDQRYVRNNLLLKLYNINPAQPPAGFKVNGHWISQVGERIYFDRIEIAENVKNLVGAVIPNDEIVAAFDGQLLLLEGNGEIIEHLGGTQGVPAGMRAIGLAKERGGLVVRGAHGDYSVDIDNLKWHEHSYLEADWSEPETLPAPLEAELMQLYRGKGLPVERVILDLHSGRLLGNFGVYLIDAMAILFLLLALSGIWMWYKKS